MFVGGAALQASADLGHELCPQSLFQRGLALLSQSGTGDEKCGSESEAHGDHPPMDSRLVGVSRGGDLGHGSAGHAAAA